MPCLPCACNCWCATRNRNQKQRNQPFLAFRACKKRKEKNARQQKAPLFRVRTNTRPGSLDFRPWPATPTYDDSALQFSAGVTTRVDGGASRFPIADPVSGPSAAGCLVLDVLYRTLRCTVSARPWRGKTKKETWLSPLPWAPTYYKHKSLVIICSRCHRGPLAVVAFSVRCCPN